MTRRILVTIALVLAMLAGGPIWPEVHNAIVVPAQLPAAATMLVCCAIGALARPPRAFR